jgi:hypothetical protein
MNSFFNFEIMKLSIIYYDICDMSSEIIQRATYDNYNDFQHVNFIFAQNFISLFLGIT